MFSSDGELRRRGWGDFFEKTKNEKPSPNVIEALDFVTGRNLAYDLGAGALRDSNYLVNEGFNKVIAIDSFNGIQDISRSDSVEVVCADMASYDLGKENSDFITAQNSLPFIPRDNIFKVITNVKKSLKRGGIFSASFFGNNDDWKKDGKNMTFLSEGEIRELLNEFEIIKLEEKELDGESALGVLKHWHRFRVIARKKF